MSSPAASSQPRRALSQISWRPTRLRGERVLLRGYELTDAPAIHAYASDPETTRYVAWDTHSSIEGAHQFLNGWVAENYRRKELVYALCLADDPERVIGGLGVLVASTSHKTMELGYILNRAYWGRGLVPEAARLVIDRAFRLTDVERIVAPIFAENARSRAAAAKLGMTFEGVLRSALLFRGRRWDQATYSILRAEWAAWNRSEAGNTLAR